MLLEFDGEARFHASQSTDHPSTEVPGRPTMSRHLLQSPDSLAPAQLPPSESNALAEWKIARGLRDVFEFSQVLLEQPNATVIAPGERHWDIFERLCRESKATGNLVQDAWFAALAVESGCEWITLDRDYARFPVGYHGARRWPPDITSACALWPSCPGFGHRGRRCFGVR